ncbi:glucose-6-phosphate isomerase [Enterococcus hirae]|uniref:glucose-6-phosphate isomerase family protein n=1 Tax=Enterococcus sp. C63 TaxID=3231324 RepID=UPI001A0D101F|nr:glucose-6-phosphate isomerase [Enterococcus hirae]EMF0130602.1 glucose-6-phosphate isomerase [Enterococcus hirae]EMF0450235.1 glucose-6-phosphate isomerase [Enterococcus hirae]EMF0515591.1 glucose-6-phosphate isomerase [Enterococcus hirae]EMF0518787.1 glucose-6-phosphate isomerase [Enterococcus hirae]
MEKHELNVFFDQKKKRFVYSEDMFGPVGVEHRYLADIRHSLLNDHVSGPEIVYTIAMDIGKKKDQHALQQKGLLYGIVEYAAGKLGNEPIKSQGHRHAISKISHMSTPEVFEILEGQALIYMQENLEKNAGKCYAVEARKGDIVIVPPGWGHCTINASTELTMCFGAWCVRDYAFDYTVLKKQQGFAFVPIFDHRNNLVWKKNDHYTSAEWLIKKPREYHEFGLKKRIPIYYQYEQNPDLFNFVSHPENYKQQWEDFIP